MSKFNKKIGAEVLLQTNSNWKHRNCLVAFCVP